MSEQCCLFGSDNATTAYLKAKQFEIIAGSRKDRHSIRHPAYLKAKQFEIIAGSQKDRHSIVLLT